MREFSNGTILEAGDIFTDGSPGQEDVRRANKAKVLYIDKYCFVWFPLNEYTSHASTDREIFRSKDWGLSAAPIKLSYEDLTPEEQLMYDTSNDYV